MFSVLAIRSQTIGIDSEVRALSCKVFRVMVQTECPYGARSIRHHGLVERSGGHSDFEDYGPVVQTSGLWFGPAEALDRLLNI